MLLSIYFAQLVLLLRQLKLARRGFNRSDERSLRAFASMPSTAIFFASTSRNKKNCFASLRATQKFGEHEQASTRLNFASKSSKGKILRAVKNFNGPFITPFSRIVITRILWKRAAKTHLFINAPQTGVFFKTLSSCLHVDGQLHN